MEKEIIKKAFESAEKETQEKQVEFIKKIVQKYLEKIDSLSKEKEKVDEEMRLLKKDLDDLKAGRLDKIEERQKVDPEAKNISLVLIRKIERGYIPLAPWRSPWEIMWNNALSRLYDGDQLGGPSTSCSSGPSISYGSSCTGTYTTTGTTASNFTSGTYVVNGKIINF